MINYCEKYEYCNYKGMFSICGEESRYNLAQNCMNGGGDCLVARIEELEFKEINKDFKERLQGGKDK